MHAKTALPCAWALGTVLVLTGCASRGPTTTHPLDLPVALAVVQSDGPPAVRAPSSPSVLLLRPGCRSEDDPRAVPLGHEETVQPGLSAPTLRADPRPAPCALTPELTARRPLLRTRGVLRRPIDTGPCVGGT